MADYVYYNRSGTNEHNNDCVTRAISLATNLPYPEIRDKLYLTSKLLECEKLCVSCYKFLIEDVFKCKRVNCDGLYAGDFADLHPYGTYLLRMNGHIVCCIDGYIYDIFDSRYYELLTDAWEVK